MFPHSQGPSGQGGGNLEEHLRGLILSNQSNASLIPAQFAQHAEQIVSGDGHGVQNVQASRVLSSRRRPNQAQRRQLDTKTIVPADFQRLHRIPQTVFGSEISGSSLLSYVQPNQNHHYQHPQQHSPRFQNHAYSYSPHTQFPQSFLESPSSSFQRPVANQLPQQNNANTYPRPRPQNRQLYQPFENHALGRSRPPGYSSENVANQAAQLEILVQEIVPRIGIDSEESAQKEAFRSLVESKCRDAITRYENQDLGNNNFDPLHVELRCFGSMKSGFATKGSDMDLALLAPKLDPAPESPESRVPRLLEKALLDLGYGARLLTRTRVPIIKLCEKPNRQLLSDLLEERRKWDRGFQENEIHDEAMELSTHKVSGKNKSITNGDGSRPNSAETGSYSDKLASLKQSNEHCLGDYFNITKRLLKNLGGRDVSSNSPDLTPEEGQILKDVGRAFISGLASEDLSSRLRSYKSLLPLFNSHLPYTQRSLQGIFIQVEGERLAAAWDCRPLPEANDQCEFEARSNVQSWRVLQDAEGPAIENSLYNKQLYAATERLKKIPSLQLAFLEQIQHEDPTFYLGRVSRIKDQLQPWDKSAAEKVASVVVSRYISGIRNSQIRELLQSSDQGATLQQIGLHHRLLQLCVDYEHALQVGLYKNHDHDIVKQFVAFIRSLKFKDLSFSHNVAAACLVDKMRRMPDPTKVSLNKPKCKDHLEFPKADVGIQCDINFSADLAIHNTQLLRCYSHSDPRVKDMILFVKYWAKTRGINTPYRGSLSSYGYVLMVLHYLVNVAQPFVCPNLQMINRDLPEYLPPAQAKAISFCKGKDVRFWRNEAEIRNFALQERLNHNRESVGMLLRGFFEYFAQNGSMSNGQGRCFDWGRDVLSLRTIGGLLSKQEKDWVGAKTVIETTTVPAPPTPKASELILDVEKSSSIHAPKIPIKTVEETKEIRHRYLFAIEDPFELDHNVARTVTHNGIVSIRDEFRRAWRIIRSIGKSYQDQDGGLLDPISDASEERSLFTEMLDILQRPSQ